MEVAELEALVAESLATHAEAAGMRPWRADGVVHLGHGVACRVAIDPPRPRTDGALLAVWFTVGTGDGAPPIVESLVGIGATAAEAAVHAAHDFVETVLPAVRGLVEPGYANAGMAEIELVSRDVDTGRETRWRVLSAPPLLWGEAPDALRAAVDAQSPLLRFALNTVTGFLHLRERHWVKIYLCRGANGVTGEVRVDNEPVPEGLEEARAFRWPDAPPHAVMTVRQFVLLEPMPGEAAPDAELRAALDRAAAPASPPRRQWWPFGR